VGAAAVADVYRFVLGALATWRVAHLITAEDGPADVIVRLRARAGAGVVGDAMDCFACTSVWAAAPVALTVIRRPRELAVTWLALTGAACLLERLGADTQHSTDARGSTDGLLWSEAQGVAG